MLTWMLYVVVITLLLSGAALAAEHAARLRRARSRWIWTLTIVASLGIPTLIASVSIQVPDLLTPTVSRKATALRELTSVQVVPLSWVRGRTGNTVESVSENRVLQRAWVVVSVALLAALVLNGLYLQWRKRRWRIGTVGGVPVYVAPDAGPAVVGLLRPRIVVPEWLAHASPSRQAMVIAHEQSHLRAHDPQVLTVALFLLVLMPWNLPLWWQLHRLRYAIEVDCDTRVLKGGLDTEQYGETLIDVSQHPFEYIGSVAAMSESRSFLEERIKMMVRSADKRGAVTAVIFGGVALALVAVAAQVTPPVLSNSTGSGEQAVVLAPPILDRYVGFYQRSEHALVSMTRDGPRLIAQLTGNPAVELVAHSNTEFSVPVVPDARFTFLLDGREQVTGVVLRRAFYTFTMPRIDASAADLIMANTNAKIQSQRPTPGSEAALRRMIDAMRRGKPNYDEMTPWFADLVRQLVPGWTDKVANYGSAQSVEFRRVGVLGGDVYEVRQEHATTYWMISLNSNGLIEEADLVVQ
jgi:bla regulator protein blaR1